MKKIKNNSKYVKYISLSNLYRDEVKTEPTVSLNNGIELLALCSNLGWRLALTIFGPEGRLKSRVWQMRNFFKYILKMNEKHGGAYTVAYLKFSQLAIQKVIAGNKLGSLREVAPKLSLPRLAASGLPRYIPLQDRRAIVNKSISLCR
jgi:hypothetical protein